MSGARRFLGRACLDYRVVFSIVAWAFFATFYRGYGVNTNYYAISQWLVTYEAGFIKRALWGSIVQLEQLWKLTHIPVPTLFFWMSNTILVLLYLCTARIIFRMVNRDQNVLYFIPYFLFSPLLRTQSVYLGYTDQVIMLYSSAIIFFIIKERHLLAALLLSGGVLIHEIIFAIVFPVLAWSFLLKTSREDLQLKSAIRQLAVYIVPGLFFGAVIVYQEFFVSKEHVVSYIYGMLERQDPPNYRADMISEIYYTTFNGWYRIHAPAAFERLMTNGYWFSIMLPVVALNAVLMLRGKFSARVISCFIAGSCVVLSPLVLHLWVVDFDRVWNLVSWTGFYILWLFIERVRHIELKSSRRWPWLFFVFSLLAFLAPQARSDIGLALAVFIFAPFFVWYIFLLLFVPPADHQSPVPCEKLWSSPL